jgi:hypothetical protein
MAQTGQQRTLAGHLRVQSTGQIIPFTLVLAGDTIRYEFKDEAIILRLGENGSQLMEAAHGDLQKGLAGAIRQAGRGHGHHLRGYLAEVFVLAEGEDRRLGDRRWAELLEAAPRAGRPALRLRAVELWVSKRTGNFLEGEGYDAAGKLVKRFKVVSGQRDPQGGWMLKKMRIETLGREGESITYLEIDK